MAKLLLFINSCILCLLLSLQGVKAQENPRDQYFAERAPKLIIKWAWLSLIDPDQTVQFGVEYALNKQWSLQQEIGYGHFLPYSTDNEDKDREIWRFRTEGRFYFSSSRPNPMEGTYVAAEIFYKRNNYLNEITVGRECENGNCAFFQQKEYIRIKDVVGYHIKIGRQWVISRRVALDIYAGLGLRSIHVKTPGLSKEEQENINRDYVLFGYYSSGSYLMPSLSSGFKFGYQIYKKNK